MPRLDWRIWFEALAWERALKVGSPIRPSAWFGVFLDRLLLRSPKVVGLLARDPLGGAPPAQVRVLLYQYRFATPDDRSEDGRWWTREWVHTYRHP